MKNQTSGVQRDYEVSASLCLKVEARGFHHLQSWSQCEKHQEHKIVTCYEKRDHWGCFKNFWHKLIALCVLNTVVQVSYKNIDHKWSYDHFYALVKIYIHFSENAHF